MTTAYLTPEDIALRLEHPKPTGRGGYIGRCPAHEDVSPSLSVDPGRSCTLLYCHAGCDVGAICLALEIRVEQLYHNYDPERSPNGRAELELADLVRKQRASTRYELQPFETLSDVMYEVFPNAPAERWAWVGVNWFDYMETPFNEILDNKQNFKVVIEAIAADLMADDIDNGYDYTLGEQHRLADRMRATWKRFGNT